jgi:hypothetical protein
MDKYGDMVGTYFALHTLDLTIAYHSEHVPVRRLDETVQR